MFPLNTLRNRIIRRYYYYKESGYIKYDCPDIRIDIKAGSCYLGFGRRIYEGPIEVIGRPFYKYPDILIRDIIR